MKHTNNGYLSIKNIQAMTGLSYLTVYRQFTEGKLKGAFQMGKQWLISLDDWDNNIERLKNENTRAK
jgi:predicted site-specific integrase-resolvase